jgi:hypothetical protein
MLSQKSHKIFKALDFCKYSDYDDAGAPAIKESVFAKTKQFVEQLELSIGDLPNYDVSPYYNSLDIVFKNSTHTLVLNISDTTITYICDDNDVGDFDIIKRNVEIDELLPVIIYLLNVFFIKDKI